MLGIFIFLLEKAGIFGKITSAQMYSERCSYIEVKKNNGNKLKITITMEEEKKDA